MPRIDQHADGLDRRAGGVHAAEHEAGRERAAGHPSFSRSTPNTKPRKKNSSHSGATNASSTA